MIITHDGEFFYLKEKLLRCMIPAKEYCGTMSYPAEDWWIEAMTRNAAVGFQE